MTTSEWGHLLTLPKGSQICKYGTGWIITVPDFPPFLLQPVIPPAQDSSVTDYRTKAIEAYQRYREAEDALEALRYVNTYRMTDEDRKQLSERTVDLTIRANVANREFADYARKAAEEI